MMFKLSKPCALTTAVHIEGEVGRALERVATDIEREDGWTFYNILGGRFSMFAPYSRARFGRQGDEWVLQLTPSRQLLVPFAIFALALVVFRTMGPITFSDAALVFALPFFLVGAVILECQSRLRRWWNLL